MDYKKGMQINSLDDLISCLRETFEKDEVDIDYVQELMSTYHSNPLEWKKYAIFDPHRYTRNLVDTGNGKYNLMLICWGQGQGSAIHDHANSHCFMKMLNGEITEIRFDWPEKKAVDTLDADAEPQALKVLSESILRLNEVTYINDDIGLHRMENRDHVMPAVSLHLYSPPYSSCHTFNQHTGHSSCIKVTFTSKFGKRTPFKVKSADTSSKQAKQKAKDEETMKNNVGEKVEEEKKTNSSNNDAIAIVDINNKKSNCSN